MSTSIVSDGLKPRFVSLPEPGSPSLIASVDKSHNYVANDPVTVTPLKYNHVPKTSRSWQDAFQTDPLERYIQDTPDSKHRKSWPYCQEFARLALMIIIACSIRHVAQITNTIDKGSSTVIGVYAANSPEGKKRPSDVLLEKSLRRFLDVIQWIFDTRQQAERRAERNTKLKAAVQANIGENAKDMVLLNVLFSSPESQGRGYASALARSITSIADAQHRSTLLVSSNVANTGFYNSQGFQTAGHFVLGEANRDWHKPPLVVNIMVREPAAGKTQELDEKAVIPV